MKKLLAISLSVLLLTSTSINSSNAATAVDGNLCKASGPKTAKSAKGITLECQRGADGKYAWHPAQGSGSGNGNGGGNGNSGKSPMASNSLQNIMGNMQCKGNSSTLTAGFIDTSKVDYFVPLGSMTSSHITPIDHIYVYYPNKNGQVAALAAGSALVTSPAAGNIISVEDFSKTNQYPYADYRIVVAHSCSLYSIFIHVGKLVGPAEAIVKQLGGRGSWSGSIPVKAGDSLSDDSEHPGFDYTLLDGNKKLSGFANYQSYAEQDSWKPWTADVLSYLPANLKAAYESKFLSTTAPIGGKIDWDKPGTAQGNWYVKNTNGYRGLGDNGASFNNHGKIAHGYWDTHLAIAPDAVDRTATIFSIGDWEGCPCQFVSKSLDVTGTSITQSSTPTVVELTEYTLTSADGTPSDFMHPARGYKIKSTGSVVGLLALQVQSDGSLKVEKLPGKTSKSEFTGFSSAAKIYTH